MRVKLQAKLDQPYMDHTSREVPICVTIRPANNVEGSFDYHTSSAAFLTLLRRRTDLRRSELLLFASELQRFAASRILAVTFKEDLLQDIGYYID